MPIPSSVHRLDTPRLPVLLCPSQGKDGFGLGKLRTGGIAVCDRMLFTFGSRS